MTSAVQWFDDFERRMRIHARLQELQEKRPSAFRCAKWVGENGSGVRQLCQSTELLKTLSGRFEEIAHTFSSGRPALTSHLCGPCKLAIMLVFGALFEQLKSYADEHLNGRSRE